MDSTIGPGTLFCAECGRPSAPDELARFGELLICPDCKNQYAQKLREGVAPAISVEYAGFWIRFVAAIIDGIIMLVVNTIIDYALTGVVITPFRQPTPDVRPEVLIVTMLSTFGVTILVNMTTDTIYESFFVAKLGATPGKLALGLKIVRSDGAPVGLGRAVGRHFSKTLSAMILMIGYIMAGFDDQKRALHDMICDTRVIKARPI